MPLLLSVCNNPDPDPYTEQCTKYGIIFDMLFRLNYVFSVAGEDMLRMYMSNERIPPIAEEAPCFPVPYRTTSVVLRGVDHIRGSQCFINAELHSSATVLYQDTTRRKNRTTRSTKRSSEPSPLSAWFARLKLFTH